jgi:hypothetical protein
VIQVDAISNANYYRAPAPGQPVSVPAEAQQLVQQITMATGQVATVPTANRTVGVQPTLAQKHSKDKASTIRDELARSAPHLYELLDAHWQNYLALPAEIFQGQGHPSQQALAECQKRFNTIRNDPQYATLAQRPEFQSTLGLLQHYLQAISPTQPTISLPPPPGGNGQP